MISATKRTVPPTEKPKTTTPKKNVEPITSGVPRFKKKEQPVKKPVLKRELEAKKKPSEQKNPKLNVAEVISLIKGGKTGTAINVLKEYQCTSPEGCGFVIFHDGLCFNHYHVKMKYGRTERVNTKHAGELCTVCKKRPATNRDKCLPCYARLKYHADKEKGIIKGKKAPKKQKRATAPVKPKALAKKFVRKASREDLITMAKEMKIPCTTKDKTERIRVRILKASF